MIQDLIGDALCNENREINRSILSLNTVIKKEEMCSWGRGNLFHLENWNNWEKQRQNQVHNPIMRQGSDVAKGSASK